MAYNLNQDRQLGFLGDPCQVLEGPNFAFDAVASWRLVQQLHQPVRHLVSEGPLASCRMAWLEQLPSCFQSAALKMRIHSRTVWTCGPRKKAMSRTDLPATESSRMLARRYTTVWPDRCNWRSFLICFFRSGRTCKRVLACLLFRLMSPMILT